MTPPRPVDASAAEALAPRGPSGARLLPYPWELIVFLWLAYFLNQADRQVYNVVLPLIKSDLRLSDVQLGLVASAFTASYALLVPLAGFAGDRLRRKWVVCGSLGFWSVATLLTGISSGLGQLIAFRGLTTGGGEAFYYPSANSLIGQFHHRTRALAMAIHQTSLYAGIVASGFIAGYIGEHYGWRSAFFVFGSFGVGLAVVMVFRLRDTPQPAPPCDDARQPSFFEVARAIFRKRTVWALSLAFGGMVFTGIGYLTWMPTFLHEKFGLSLTQAGFSSMFYHHLLAFAGVLIGGRLSDRWAARRRSVRMEVELVGLLLAVPFICLTGLATDFWLCCIGMAGFGFFRGLYDSNLFAALFDVIEPRYRASAVGVMLSFAFLVGALAPVALGWVKQIHGLTAGIATLSVGYFAGALCILAALLLSFRRDYCPEPATD
jgi:MFS family permease